MAPSQKTPVGAASERTVEERRRLFAEYMASKGLKSTRQRHAVAEVFFHSQAHLSIDEVLALVRRKHPSVGYATVYRTLKLLAEAGLADERHFTDGVARYEQSHDEEHHDHMVCTSCGKVIEFVNLEIEALQQTIASRSGFKMTNHKLELYGVCKDCQ